MSRMLAVDLRSLALLRISYGLFLLLDLLIRAVDIVPFYTDYGACPRAAVLELGWQRAYVCLHMANGTWPFQALLFTVGGLAAIALMLGYRTRLAGLICWLHLVSLHNRNGMVLDGGDIYLRVILFWGLFMPWGARFSVDSVRRGEDGPPDNTWFDASTLAYLLQICMVYWFAVFHKTGVEWRSEGSAVYYALMIEQLTTPLAPLLLGYPGFMRALSWGTLGWEAVGPFFLLVNGPLRVIGVLGFIALHLGFGLFMHLAIFALIGAFSPIGMLPEWFWRRAGRGLEERLNRWFAAVSRKLALPGADPAPGPLNPAVSGVVLGLLIYCVMWNLSGLPNSKVKCPQDLGYLLRIDQMWNMFAPKPLTEDGWYVIEAKRVGGGTVDLFQRGGPVTWDKPSHVAGTYANARWRKYMMNLWSASLQSWRLHYGRYLTRSWNDKHEGPDQIKEFQIIFMKENTVANGTEPVVKVPIWTHYCFAMPSPSPGKAAK